MKHIRIRLWALVAAAALLAACSTREIGSSAEGQPEPEEASISAVEDDGSAEPEPDSAPAPESEPERQQEEQSAGTEAAPSSGTDAAPVEPAGQNQDWSGQHISLYTPGDLLRMAEEVATPGHQGKTYLLENDIDMAGVDFAPMAPQSEGFEAVLDGQGFAIRNLSIHVQGGTDPEEKYYVGLFAVIGEGGVVRDLALVDCDIRLELPRGSLSANAAGGMAGECFGVLNLCTVTGRVEGVYQVGGLAGKVTEAKRIEECHVDVAVEGNAEIGALIGSVGNATVQSCTARGDVVSVDKGMYDRPRAIGGFVGFSVGGSIRDCNSSVTVKTMAVSDWVGGFMGYNQGEITGCLYNLQKTINWEAVDVVYNNAYSDVSGVEEANLSLPVLR